MVSRSYSSAILVPSLISFFDILINVYFKVDFFTLWLYMCFGIKHSLCLIHVVVVDAVVVVWLCPSSCDPWTAACQASLSFTISQSLLKFTSMESVMPSNHLILCGLLVLLPSIFPSLRVFSNESVLHIRWPKYWSFSFNISPSNEYSGLISFRIDWFDLLAVQGTLKSLLQHHSSEASTLQYSNILMVQLSHPYMTTGKTIALTRWTFVGKVMSLLFNSCCVINRCETASEVKTNEP